VLRPFACFAVGSHRDALALKKGIEYSTQYPDYTQIQKDLLESNFAATNIG